MKNAFTTLVGLGCLGALVLAGVGCGGSSQSGGSEIMDAAGSAGSGGTGGSGFIPINSGGGGSSDTGGSSASAGTASVAGSSGFPSFGGSNVGGSGGSGPQGTPGYPMGTVDLCFGDCPLGECDDSMFFAQTPCASVYKSDIGPSSSYCSAGQNGSYCIQVGAEFSPDFGVSCANGMATVLKCNDGCGSVGTGPHECD
jgi:hypothetical protein